MNESPRNWQALKCCVRRLILANALGIALLLTLLAGLGNLSARVGAGPAGNIPPAGQNIALQPQEALGEGVWTPLNGPLTSGGQVDALAVQPAVSGTLFAAGARPGSYDSGPSTIYKSTDGAATWTAVYTAEHQVYALAAAGSQIYAGAFNPGGEGPAIYVSQDNGLSWTAAFSFTHRGVWIDASAHPTDADVAIMGGWQIDSGGTGRGLVYGTDNGGLSWSSLLTYTSGGHSHIDAVLIHPVSPTLLLAAGHTENSPDGVIFRSTNGGATWPVSFTISGAQAIALAANSTTPGILYAGTGNSPWTNSPSHVYRSLDAGLTWTRVLTDQGGLVAFEPPSTVHMATDWGGWWVSASDGDPETWNHVGDAPDGARASALDLASAPAATYLGGHVRGVFRSQDGGASWAQRSQGMPVLVQPRDIDIDPADPDRLFVATEFQGSWLSDDGGQTWTRLADIPDPGLAFAIVPTATHIVYAGSSSCHRGTILRSADGGLSFSDVYTPSFLTGDCGAGNERIETLAVAPSAGDTVYGGGRFERNSAGWQAVVVRSLDGGLSWSQVFSRPAGSQILALAIGPQDSATLFAGGEDCSSGNCSGFVYRSNDGGASWTETLVTSNTVTSIVVDWQNSAIVYAADQGYAVRKSSDGGDTWTVVRANWMPDNPPSGKLLALDPGQPDWPYLAGWGYVAESSDGGLTWRDYPLDNGTPDMEPQALAVDHGEPVQTFYGGFDGVWSFQRPAPKRGDRYVAATGDDSLNACTNPASPCRSIGHAADVANAGETIRIAGGAYVENLRLSRPVTLAGGYEASGWTRDLAAHETIVDGSGVKRQDNPVVRVEPGAADSTLDGLTLTGGHGDTAGGVDAAGSSVIVRNCLIHDNWANGEPNSAGGGGIAGYQAIIIDSRIVDNEVVAGAGGVRIYEGYLEMVNIIVAGNNGDEGLHLNGSASLMNVTIAYNAAGSGRPGILFNPPNPQAGETLLMTNSIIYGNGWGDAFHFNDPDSIQASYSDIQGGWPGTGNIDAPPILLNPAAGDYHLSVWSPAIDAGTASGAPDHDFEGDARPQNAAFDMGADEYVGPGITSVFSDVASAQGLGFSTGEFGAAWGDLDGDGWLDLAIGNGSIYSSSQGAFSNVSVAAGLDIETQHGGLAWGDYDNDGDLDLMSNKRKVYRQNSLPFSKIMDQDGQQTSMAWVDYDGDGDLDVYADGRLYRNEGNDFFADMTAQAGLSLGPYMAAVWADYDDDGDPDLYLTCTGCPNVLYQNDGDGRFSDVSAAAGVDDNGSGHGAAWGDYDNDGDFDLFVANNNGEFSALYRNNGDSTFSDVSVPAGLHDRPGNATGCNWLDFDLDGWLDLFVVNRGDTHRLYRNDGNGAFMDVAAVAQVADPGSSEGSTVGDYDNDGDPDIFVVGSFDNTPNQLFQNLTPPGAAHWLKVQLSSQLSNRSAIGARARVYAGGLMQTRQLAGSSGYLSQDALEALFGLGSYSGTLTLEITWPSGAVTTQQNVAADQTVIIDEPPGEAHDIAVIAINEPKAAALNGSSITPRTTIRNLGASTEHSIPVRLTVEVGGSLVYSQTAHVASLGSLMSTMVAFPAFTFGGGGDYLFTFTALLPTDQVPANDSMQRVVDAGEGWVDIWTKDYPGDTGHVPTYDWWQSPDIWVRHANDGGLMHQQPVQGVVNYVHVRVRNRGNITASNVTVDVYWHEPSLGIICGDWAFIGTANIPSLPSGASTVVVAPWTPTRSGHTCLHDMIYNAQDPVTFPCDVPNDNNIEQRNVDILANPDTPRDAKGLFSIDTATFQITNIFQRPASVDVNITRGDFPVAGQMALTLDEELFDRWWTATGGTVLGGEADPVQRSIALTGAVSSTVQGLPMFAEELVTATLELASDQAADFTIEITEYIDGQPVGGNVYLGHTCQAEDLNCDGAVDVLDIQQAAGSWNNAIGDEKYNLWADFDEDGLIDIRDVMHVVASWSS